MTWKTLPIAGHELEAIVVFGNGKDCRVTISTLQSPTKIEFWMRDPTLELVFNGSVKTTVTGEGHDVYLGVKYVPLEPMQLAECSIYYFGAESEWDEALQEFSKGNQDFIGETIYDAKIVAKSL